MSATQKLMQAAGGYGIAQPACPSCGKALQLSRIMPGTSHLPDLRTYACRECGVWLTEADRHGGAKDPSS
jgi:hypothetical protein